MSEDVDEGVFSGVPSVSGRPHSRLFSYTPLCETCDISWHVSLVRSSPVVVFRQADVFRVYKWKKGTVLNIFVSQPTNYYPFFLRRRPLNRKGRQTLDLFALRRYLSSTKNNIYYCYNQVL